MEIGFARPWFLLLILPTVIWVVWYWRGLRQAEHDLDSVCEASLQAEMTTGGRTSLGRPLALMGLVFLSVLVLSGLSFEREPMQKSLNQYTNVLIVNVDALDSASIVQFEQALLERDDRWRLIAYEQVGEKSQAFDVLSATRDASVFMAYLRALNADVMPDNEERFASNGLERAKALVEPKEQGQSVWVVDSKADWSSVIGSIESDKPYFNPQSSDDSVERWKDQSYWLLLLMLPLVLVFYRRGVVIAVWVLALNLPTSEPVLANGLWQTDDQYAYELYQNREFDLAAKAFKDLNWKATAYFRAQDYEQAARVWAKVDSDQARFNQAVAWSRAGELVKAQALFEQVFLANPDWIEARENAELIQRLEAFEQQVKAHKNTHQDLDVQALPEKIMDLSQPENDNIAYEDYDPKMYDLLQQEVGDGQIENKSIDAEQTVEQWLENHQPNLSSILQKRFYLQKNPD